MPSIDVPLLRSERSALRSRQVARWLLLVALAAAGSAMLALGWIYRQPRDANRDALAALPDEAEDSAPPAPTGSSPEPTFLPDPGAAGVAGDPPPRASASAERAPQTSGEPTSLTTVSARLGSASRSSHSFGNAISFRDALERAGLSRDESMALITGLTGIVDFRRSHPEDTFIIERDSQGGLTRFEYKASLTQRYEAAREVSGKWKARQIEVPVRIQRVARGGLVTGSLGDTLEGLKLGRTLAGVFSEVFEGHVNFSTDTRSGDQFRIIFDEEYVEDSFLRYGTVHAVEYRGDKAGKLRAFWHEIKGDGDFFEESGRAMHGGWLRTPLRYDHVSSGFGMRFHPVLKRKQLHNGIDYAAATGTPVRAGAAGTVTFAGSKGANGNLVVISHTQGYETFYAHLSRFGSGLKSGVKVSQRQVIAYVGSTGRSTGPHLHFSLKRGGKFIDPASQLNGTGLPMPPHDLPDYKRHVRELSSALDKITPEQPAHVSSAPSAANSADLSEEEL
jgi:murein DD-endopeptidase MepM/ murein hydrolase activator NlpD